MYEKDYLKKHGVPVSEKVPIKKMKVRKLEEETIGKIQNDSNKKMQLLIETPFEIKKEIDIIKDLVRQRMFEDANNRLVKLKEYQENLGDIKNKKLLYYDVLELENNIKIAKYRN